MYSEIAKNKRRSVILIVFFVIFVSLILVLVSQVYGTGTAIVAVIGSAVYTLWSIYGSDKAALALNRARKIEKQEYPEYYRIIENLSISEGLPMPSVYIVDDPAPNAFATGRDPQHASIAVTTGLLEIMDKSELEGVCAHELGHIKNYDIRVSLITFALVSIISVIADISLRARFIGGRKNDNNSSNGILVFIALIAIILAPIAANLIKLAISRKREYLADATGAETTRYPEGLASALQKIAQHGSVLQTQNTSTAHLFFANPIKSSFFVKYLSTHPPVDDRIARLRQMVNNV